MTRFLSSCVVVWVGLMLSGCLRGKSADRSWRGERARIRDELRGGRLDPPLAPQASTRPWPARFPTLAVAAKPKPAPKPKPTAKSKGEADRRPSVGKGGNFQLLMCSQGAPTAHPPPLPFSLPPAAGLVSAGPHRVRMAGFAYEQYRMPWEDPRPEGRDLNVEGGTKGAVPPRGPEVQPRRAQVSGGLDAATVRRVVRRSLPRIRRCYLNVALQVNPGLSGELVVTFTVRLDGTVMDAAVSQRAFNHPKLESCLLEEVRRWRFPTPEGSVVRVRYPFHFTAGR